MSCRGLTAMLTTLLLAFSVTQSSASTAQADPADVVRETAGKIINTLREHEEEFRADPKCLKNLVRRELLPALDIAYSARLILGRAGRGATADQLDAFSEAMSNLLIDRYAAGLLEYRNRDQLEILPTRGEVNERMTRVRTRVQLDSGKFIPVDYIFHRTEDGWKAFDVIVEGISYVTTYRNQIMPQVEASGIEAVTDRLERGELQLED